jgi:guanine deaminase
MNMSESHEFYMNVAFEEAFSSVRNNIGGPFGAVVVMDGKIIGKGGNQVLLQNDPTAHAEITAIRDAGKKISNFDLSGAVLYATCEPCPMCLSAIYWANIGAVFFTSTRLDAASIGFRDNHIYEELNLPFKERKISFHQLNHPMADGLLREWSEKQDKRSY